MTKAVAPCLALVCLILLAHAGSHPSSAQVAACQPYSVTVPVLQVLRDPAAPDDFITVLQEGDTACVLEDVTVGPERYGFVVDKTGPSGQSVAVGGWASKIFMTRVVGQVVPSREGTTAAEPEPLSPPSGDTDAGNGTVLRFEEPVPSGPPEVRGKTLRELAEGEPLFPPIEGLPEDLWQKPCTTCHQWNRERLCDQGNSYVPRAAEVFRHQHPYGGVYKLSLMRWAQSGCQ